MLLILSVPFVSFSRLSSIDTARALYPRWSPEKKIVEFGWGGLTPRLVIDNMASLSTRPFDGLVFGPDWPQANPGPQSIFYPLPVAESAMNLDVLESIQWSETLTDNFLFFWTVHDNAGWFNDAQWETVLANAEVISRANAAARTKGVFFDTEYYDGDIWRYNTTLYPSHTFAQAQAKVRRRGTALMQALQKHSPGIKVLCTGAWIFSSYGIGGDESKLQDSEYALLKSFCDGMLEGARGESKFIEGNEIGYYWRGTINWHWQDGAYNVISNTNFIASELADTWATNGGVGHGFYYEFYKPATDAALQKQLEHHIYQQLLLSDEYVWFYTEESRQFWLDPFPSAPAAAIRSAKERIGNWKKPGFVWKDDEAVYSSDLQIISPAQDQVYDVGDTIEFSIDNPARITDGITYWISYRKTDVGTSPYAYKALAVHPGTYLVYALRSGWAEQSNPVVFHVRDGSAGIKSANKPAVARRPPVPGSPAGAKLFGFNARGRLVKRTAYATGTMLGAAMDDLPGGIYFIQLRTGARIDESQRLVVAH